MDTPATAEPVYFRPEYAPHIELFRCEPLHASLTKGACARRHAQQDDYPCAGCPTGAMHAAQLGIRVIRDKTRACHTRPCSRCGRHEFRLIGCRLCISCFNREREWKLRRNRKGAPPRIPLLTWEVLLTASGGLGTRPLAGIVVQALGMQEYAMQLAALDEAEVKRVINSIWPRAEIIAIGPAAQPEDGDNQRRNSARQAERIPGSLMA